MSHSQINVQRRTVLASLGLSVVTPLSFAVSEAQAQAQIVDRSGSLRMMSQRMVKAYCQLGQGVLPGEAETILARSATRFDGALIAVRENKASDQSIIKRIEPAWLQLRDLVTVSPSEVDRLEWPPAHAFSAHGQMCIRDDVGAGWQRIRSTA